MQKYISSFIQLQFILISYHCYLQTKSSHYFNNFLTGYWWTRFHRILMILSVYQSWHYDLNIRISYFNLFYFLLCWFTAVPDVISSGMDICNIRFLTEYRFDVIFYVLCCSPWLCSYLFVMEIPLSAKPFIIESPMIKTIFLSLVTFFSFCGVFISWGSLLLFSLTASASRFF